MGVARVSQRAGRRIGEVSGWVKTVGGGHMFVINMPHRIKLLQHMDRGSNIHNSRHLRPRWPPHRGAGRIMMSRDCRRPEGWSGPLVLLEGLARAVTAMG